MTGSNMSFQMAKYKFSSFSYCYKKAAPGITPETAHGLHPVLFIKF